MAMNIAILAPSPVPFVLGGAENLWSSLLDYLNTHTEHQADLIKLPSPERNFWEIVASYRAFSELNLDHFDVVIVTKYPAWMVQHSGKVLYLQHKLRGLYDTYPQHLSSALPDHPALTSLKVLLQTEQPNYAHLPELWRLLDLLKTQANQLPHDYFSLPSPLIRAIVHFMDRIALQTGEVQHYMTLSKTVADRADYFPISVTPQVLAHPSGLVSHAPRAYRTIFTTSRHDSAKRLDLLIRAYRQTQVSYPLLIAGEGPQTEALKHLAQGDNRIQFLGRLSPEALSRAYSEALYVPFMPYQEDLGLITLEAFNSQKAVLTTTDSGGAAEIVQHQRTGLVVEPNVDAIATAITELCANEAQTIAMGKAGYDSVQNIQWRTLCEQLLTHAKPRSSASGLLVLNTYSIYPPLGGGQQRMYQLYRQVAQSLPVRHLALVPALGSIGELEIASHFHEERIARSLYHQAQELALADQLSASVGDLSVILYHNANPLYQQRLKRLLQDQPLVVVSHPYCYPLLAEVYQGAFIYEAHNVEADLKQSILGHSPEHLQQVIDTERTCAQKASLVVACSQQDAQRLIELYELSSNKVVVVPNGTDAEQTKPATVEHKRLARQQLGYDDQQVIALFMASYHGPNNQALEHILQMAPLCPMVQFVVLGSVKHHAVNTRAQIPHNVRLTGAVSEEDKQAYLSASDLALNPMTTGSGTNLKMLDYAAAGLLIVSTPFGGRGGILQAGCDYVSVEIEQFAQTLMDLAEHRTIPYHLQQQISARNSVEQTADWRVIANTYLKKLHSVR